MEWNVEYGSVPGKNMGITTETLENNQSPSSRYPSKKRTQFKYVEPLRSENELAAETRRGRDLFLSGQVAKEQEMTSAASKIEFLNPQSSFDTRRRKFEGKEKESLQDQMAFFTENLIYTWNNITATASEPLLNFRNIWREITDMEPETERTLNPSASYAGELFAVLGAGGVGKSTLLNILSFRHSARIHVGGDRCLNGVPVDQRVLQDLSGFIHGEERFMPKVTVREHMLFNAMLRTKFVTTMGDNLERVNQVMTEYGLWDYRNELIGDGLSNGIPKVARKLLAFASEVVTNPSILFCESPIRELDSVDSLMLVLAMKRFARKGKIVISTFKCPSTEAFMNFDRICIMTKGRVAFQGRIDEALSFWSQQGYNCPPYHNPSDFFLSTLSIDPKNEEACLERNEKIIARFQLTEAYRKLEKLAHRRHWKTVSMARMERNLFKDVSRYRAPVLSQLYWLVKREFVTQIRSVFPIYGRMLVVAAVALAYGLVFWDLEVDDSGVRCRTTFFLAAMAQTLLFSASCAILSLGSSSDVLKRENQQRMYRTVCFYIAKNISDLPVCVLSPCVFVAISYSMIGLGSLRSTSAQFGCLTLTLATMVASSYGYICAAVSGSIVGALAMTHMDIVHFIFYSGLLLNTETALQAVGFLHNISISYQTMENLMIVEFIKENKTDIVPAYGTSVHFENGGNVMDFYNYDKGASYWMNFTTLFLVCLVGFRFIAFVPLVFRLYLSRKFLPDT